MKRLILAFLLITKTVFATPLDEVFLNGQVILPVETGLSNLKGAGTLTDPSIQSTRTLFRYIESQIGEPPALGFFMVERLKLQPKCGIVLAIPVAPRAHKVISKINGKPISSQFSICRDGNPPAKTEELLALQQKQHRLGSMTPEEVSKQMHEAYKKGASK
jgi:hypothetical protein